MQKKPKTHQQGSPELEALRARLDEAEETLRAIRCGEVDALVVDGVGGEQVFTLKGADHSYQILVEAMSEGALTLAANGVILYANRRFAEMLKVPLDKIIGSSINDWMTPGSQASFQTLLGGGAADNRCELVLVASDAEPVQANFSVNNLLINEMPDLFCVVATDLREQKRHQEALVAAEKLTRRLLEESNQSRQAMQIVIEVQRRTEAELNQHRHHLEELVAARTADLVQAKEVAEKANQAKSVFLSHMTHELRSPLNAILGFAQLLEAGSPQPTEEQNVRLRHVIKAGWHLLELVDKILDLTAKESGQLPLPPEPVALSAAKETIKPPKAAAEFTKAIAA